MKSISQKLILPIRLFNLIFVSAKSLLAELKCHLLNFTKKLTFKQTETKQEILKKKKKKSESYALIVEYII